MVVGVGSASVSAFGLGFLTAPPSSRLQRGAPSAILPQLRWGRIQECLQRGAPSASYPSEAGGGEPSRSDGGGGGSASVSAFGLGFLSAPSVIAARRHLPHVRGGGFKSACNAERRLQSSPSEAGGGEPSRSDGGGGGSSSVSALGLGFLNAPSVVAARRHLPHVRGGGFKSACNAERRLQSSPSEAGGGEPSRSDGGGGWLLICLGSRSRLSDSPLRRRCATPPPPRSWGRIQECL
jgi:hypothetical protein